MNALEQLTELFPPTKRMPALFIGHGSPLNAIEENEFVEGFRKAAQEIPKPNAILCISAHWFVAGSRVTAIEMPRTIHDFGGFPPELYEVQYPAKGSPELAGVTKELLTLNQVELDEKWGLDHGAWAVIKHMYPKADVPVVQLSIDYTKPPSYHFELGKQLKLLRERGVLILGSGNIIHNLSMVDWPNFSKENHGYDWAIEAHDSINNYLLEGNLQPLIDYKNQGEAFQLSIPTPDHYLPLLYTLGVEQKGESISLFNDKLMAGSLSMTSLKIS